MSTKQPTKAGNNTSIISYHIGEGSIIVTFNAGYGCIYNSIRPGLTIVNQMIEVAKKEAKEGLCEYINTYAKENYYRKLV